MIYQISPLNYLGGVVLALLATICFNCAPLLMKLALDRMEEIKAKNLWASLKRMFTNKRWLSGFAVNILGGILYFVALDIAGVTIVQPLLNFGFIILAFLAHRLFGEKLDRKAILAIVLLVMMPVFITLSQVTPPLAMQSYGNVIWFSLACILLICLLYVISRKILIVWALTTGIAVGLTAAYTQWFTLVFFQTLTKTSNLFTAAWNGIVPLMLLLVGNIVGGFVFNQIGLQKNPASRFNPINGTTNVTLGILGGLLLFGQMITNWAFYGIGFAMGVIGVVLLSRYQLSK
jgi:drug/metabolite transporter (DMT)-like permease